MQIGFVLEEVEMTPRHLLGVMGRAIRRPAVRAGKATAPREVQVDIETLGGRVECVRATIHGGSNPNAI
jgi:hypothetical protein